MHRSRGRELLVFISAFRGGEACTAAADLLAFAAWGHRTVHVVLPTYPELQDFRHEPPQSPGNYPQCDRILRDMDRLNDGASFEFFKQSLVSAGVNEHRADDTISLDNIVTQLLLSEVLAA